MTRPVPFVGSILAATVALALASGCATTKVSPAASNAPRIAKPDRIVVYPFAATIADLPPAERGGYAQGSAPMTAEQLEAGRELGAKVADRLVEQINDMGMSAVVGDRYTSLHAGDLVIRGHFASVDEGSAAQRMVIGFGAGNTDLRTVVTAYVATAGGLRRVGGGTVDSEGGKGPGLFVPAIVTAATANPVGLIVMGAAKVEGQVSGRTTIDGAAKRTADAIAERLEDRFEDEGWI